MIPIDAPVLIDHLDAIIDHAQVLRALLDSHNTVDADTLMLARAIQGEGAALFGARRDELARWIAHVAYNYWEKRWWDTPAYLAALAVFLERESLGSDEVEMWMVTAQRFHGVALVPEDDLEPWAIRIAHEVMTARRAGGEDGARGALFAVSLDDIVAQGWDDAKVRALCVQYIHAPATPMRQFWFLSSWPEKEEK